MILALEVILGVAVLAGIALVISLDLPGIDHPDTDQPDIGLPDDRLLRSDDIERLRFRVVSGWRGAIRGYRFTDVDATLNLVQRTLYAYETGLAPKQALQQLRQPELQAEAEPTLDDG